MSSSQQPPTKSPLHDFPLPSLKWTTKKDRRFPSPSPSSLPRSSRTRLPPTPSEPEPVPEPDPEPEEAERQWNLRPRRKTGGGSSNHHYTTAETTTAVDFSAADKVVEKSAVRTSNGDDQKRFWIALSKEEIEEDIYAMTGGRPSRRPKKHSKIVQRQLDNVFPGLWLVGFSPYSYRHFVPSARK